MNDGLVICHAYLELSLSKVHDMVEVDKHLTTLGHLKQPLCAIIATGGGVKDMPSVMLHQKQRLHTP